MDAARLNDVARDVFGASQSVIPKPVSSSTQEFIDTLYATTDPVQYGDGVHFELAGQTIAILYPDGSLVAKVGDEIAIFEAAEEPKPPVAEREVCEAPIAFLEEEKCETSEEAPAIAKASDEYVEDIGDQSGTALDEFDAEQTQNAAQKFALSASDDEIEEVQDEEDVSVDAIDDEGRLPPPEEAAVKIGEDDPVDEAFVEDDPVEEEQAFAEAPADGEMIDADANDYSVRDAAADEEVAAFENAQEASAQIYAREKRDGAEDIVVPAFAPSFASDSIECRADIAMVGAAILAAKEERAREDRNEDAIKYALMKDAVNKEALAKEASKANPPPAASKAARGAKTAGRVGVANSRGVRASASPANRALASLSQGLSFVVGGRSAEKKGILNVFGRDLELIEESPPLIASAQCDKGGMPYLFLIPPVNGALPQEMEIQIAVERAEFPQGSQDEGGKDEDDERRREEEEIFAEEDSAIA